MIGIRINDKHNQSYGGFQYPTSGEVEALDWNPEPVCGQGLHFFKGGEGNGKIVYEQAQDPESIWQIVEADDSRAVDLGGKWKAPKLKILKSGKRDEILKRLRSLVGPTKKIVYASEFAGDRGTVLVGYYGTAQAGSYGTAEAGNYGFARAGAYGTAEAGYGGTAQAGIGGVLIFRRAALSLISFNVDGVAVKANQKYKLGDGDKLVEVEEFGGSS